MIGAPRPVAAVPRLRTAVSWVGSIALHIPLFWLLQGSPETPPLPAAAEAPVELHVASADQVKALMAGQPAEPTVQAQPKSQGTARKAFTAVWERLENVGAWNNQSAFTVKQPTKSAGALHAAAPDTSMPMPDGWKPKTPPKPTHARPSAEAGLGLAGLAPGGPGALSAGSPWQVAAPHSKAQGIRSGPALAASDAGMAGGGDIGGGDWQANDAKPTSQDIRGGESGGGGNGHAFELRGPLSGRRILNSPLPPYPSWAKEQGLEADVTVYFVVDPTGHVRSDSHVKKTSGDPRLDQIVLQTIRSWRFAPLDSVKGGDQWGLATFHFRLQG